MNRNHYNLYINNISDRTNEDRLINYFSQYGKIESYTFFKRTSQRHTAAAMITYGLSVDINSIIQQNQRMNFDGNNLLLRRTLPMTRPAYERFMTTNELLISLNKISNDEQFNEINLRNFFKKYGSIVSCRCVIPYRTYLIDFVDTNSVDWAILDEPHFYNDEELILRKYITPDRLSFSRIKKTLVDQNQFSMFEKIRRFNHLMEALDFGQRVQLRLIKCSCEEKKMKSNQKKTKEKIEQLKKICYDMKEKIHSIKLMIEQNQRMKNNIIDLYKNKIENQLNKTKELKIALDSHVECF